MSCKGTIFETLGILSDFYVNKDGYKDYTYPLAYIATLQQRLTNYLARVA